MAETRLTKLDQAPPAEWAARLKFEKEARALLISDQTVGEFARRLVASGQIRPALALLANALPKREAVWWACLAARHTLPLFAMDETRAAMVAALEAAESWVIHSHEDARRACEAPAHLAGEACPAGLAALAAFWSGGSLAPADVPPVPPPEHLTAKATLGVIRLACFKRSTISSEGRSRSCVEMALDIAGGGDGRKIAFGSAA